MTDVKRYRVVCYDCLSYGSEPEPEWLGYRDVVLASDYDDLLAEFEAFKEQVDEDGLDRNEAACK